MQIYLLSAIVDKLAFRTPGAHGQDEDLGTMVFVLHRGAKLFKVQTDISRNRNHQAYSAEGYQLSVALYRLATPIRAILNRKFVEGKCLNRFLYIASPIIHLSYIYIISYFFIKIKFIS